MLAVLCLLAAVLLGGLPAAAVDSFRLASPAAGTSLDGTFTIEVVVDPSDGEIIEGVEAQLAGPTNRVFQLNRVDGPGLDGEQRWALQVDPLGQQPMHNGRHRLVVRPVPAAGDPPYDVLVCGEEDVNIAEAVGQLRNRCGGRILCEGGPTLLDELVAADLIDELCVTLAPVLAGCQPLGHAAAPMSAPTRLHLEQTLIGDGGYLYLRYRRP